ncbi:GIY-YIG nuclease family protein [Virgibacillus sp. DJP39]|uniref:GIY-YIG nuclease family protein n=1 Tax=Virgibacillus sp. DJP39 TaxID=3409790 RepID=UPI003BB61089
MELLYLISIAIIVLFIYKVYRQLAASSGEQNTVQEWHQLKPISQRFDSKGLDSGYVYFVRESGNHRIKIGKAKNPEQRIQNDFGTMMPYEFIIIHLIRSENYHKTENLFHRYFGDKRFKGEWFDLTSKDLAWVQKEKFPREIEDSIQGY